MKNTKRILVVLLVSALLVSAMLFASSAEETFKAEGINNIEDVLEFYDYADYVSDNFEDGSISSYYVNTGNKASVTADPKNADNSVLTVNLPRMQTQQPEYAITTPETKYVVSFGFYLTTGMAKSTFGVVNGPATSATSLLQFYMDDTSKMTVKYSLWDMENNAFVLTDFTPENASFTAGNWYDVLMFIDADKGTYSFKISADGKATWYESPALSTGNLESVSQLRLACKKSGPMGTLNFSLDNVRIYCGTFERDGAKKVEVTNQTLLDLDALYNAEDTSLATKSRIAEVLNKLTNVYGYTSDVEEVKAVLNNAPTYISYAFGNEFVSRVGAIDTTKTYYPRIEWNAAIEYYNDILPANEALDTTPGMTPELVAQIIAAREAYAREVAACEAIKADSENFIKAMSTYDATSKDYDAYLKDFYTLVVGYDKFDATYAEEVAGVTDFTMEEAVALYNEFTAKYVKLNNAANTFIEAVNVMKVAENAMSGNQPGSEDYENAWGDLYNGYFGAQALYNDGNIDENLDNATHAALTEALAFFAEKKDSVATDVAACEQFLAKMKEASAATYYQAIVTRLAEAEALLVGARDKYPAVAEAKALYNSLVAAIENSQNASEAYVAAVANIAGKTTFAEKRAAVEAALLLKEEGDVLGIEGVKEANIILAEAAAEIEALVGNSEALITYVAQLKAAKTLAERRALIIKANAAAANSEPTYTGVSAAKADLASLTADFTAAVNAANGAHANAVASAVDVAGAFVSETNVNKAASVIKAFVK